MKSIPALPRETQPRHQRAHWRDLDSSTWVASAARAHIKDPIVLPLTRLSGSAVYPVLSRRQLAADAAGTRRRPLRIVLVSVAAPKRALGDLLSLRAYGHSIVLLPPHYTADFFDLAELDVGGIGVAQAGSRGRAVQLVASDPSREFRDVPWWRAVRETQLVTLASG